jgi:hypothetical protein
MLSFTVYKKKPDEIKAGTRKRKFQCDVDKFFVGAIRHIFARKQGVGAKIFAG